MHVLKITEITESTIYAVGEEKKKMYEFQTPKISIPNNVEEGNVVLIINDPPEIKLSIAFSTIYGESIERIENVKLLIRLR